jgi:uncharacterized protein YdaU (DUF1376 family)
VSESPWIKFYPSDWLAGTRGMSATEAGVYINLIAMMYERDGYLTLDMTRLARLCGATGPVFKRAFDTLVDTGKIVIQGDQITNNRVLETLLIRTEKSGLAKQSANSRWAKKDNENNDGDDANAFETQCESDAYQKPDTRINPVSPNGDTTLLSRSRGLRSEGTAPRQAKMEAKQRDVDRDFEAWWLLYPRREAKAKARKAYLKALKSVDRDVLAEGAKRYSAAVSGTDPGFIKHPAKWLQDERWSDEPPPKPDARVLRVRYAPTEAELRTATRKFKETGHWLNAYGPRPDMVSTKVPKHIRQEFGL